MWNRKTGKRYPYLWAILYGTLLTGYAVFALLDAFVLPRDIVYPEDITEKSSASETALEYGESGQGIKETARAEDAAGLGGATGLRDTPEWGGAAGSKDTQEWGEAAGSKDTPGAEVTKRPGDVSEPETNEPDGTAESVEPVVTDTSYESAAVSITITTQRKYNTEVYIADVTIQDISYLRAGLAGGVFGRNLKETTSEIAEKNNAILAVNGDYYGFRDKGFVMRNGYFYRDTARAAGDDEALVIYEDGHMEIISENGADVQTLTETAVQIFSFGPGLVGEGEILVDEHSEVEQAMRSNPRTAIGEVSPFHYILLVSDGRTEESGGLSLWELAQVMQELGCVTAYNLDGGGSSTMWFMGGIVNHPTSGHRSGERSVSDIVYIGE